MRKGVLFNINSKTYDTKYNSNIDFSPIDPDIEVNDYGTSKLTFIYKSEHVKFGQCIYSWEAEKITKKIERLIR
jgi:hypothetical protein